MSTKTARNLAKLYLLPKIHRIVNVPEDNYF